MPTKKRRASRKQKSAARKQGRKSEATFGAGKSVRRKGGQRSGREVRDQTRGRR